MLGVSHGAYDMALPQDGRNYWMLPQSPEEGGYYNYGTPGHGAGQYCHPNLLNFLLGAGRRWAMLDHRRFGVGNISLADGAVFSPHRSHRNGLQVDVRPLRKDGRQAPVGYGSPDYDREGTARLIECFRATGMVRQVFFNDGRIPRVHPMAGHDDHLHIEVHA